jgi:hypothetical protein
MNRSGYPWGSLLIVLAAMSGGDLPAHPSDGAGTPSRAVRHGVHVKPPVTPKPRASVVPADPVPNTENALTGAPLDGGIRYSWQVHLAGNTSATFEGAVGAWGWDEDGSPATATGRTEAAHWVALNLKSPSRLTIRVSRKGSAIDPLAIFPGSTAGGNLRPAFTVHSGWDSDGGDESTFPNRGPVAWAEDLSYLDHAETAGVSVEKTLTLAAGFYTIALGGNSSHLIPEPRQGYEATFASVSLEKTPKLVIRGGTKSSTTGRSVRIAGRAGKPGDVTELRLLHHGRTWTVKVRRGSWSTVVTPLDPGINTVWISPVSRYGTVFPAQRITIRRN